VSDSANTHPPGRRRAALLCVAVLTLLGFSAPAKAPAATWIVKGAGFGHGVGMSQYGAYGLGRNGRSYGAILRHYYRGTKIGKTRKTRFVRVLLTIDPGNVGFTGATGACGRRLNEGASYQARRRNGRVQLLRSNGRFIKSCGRRLHADGGGAVFIRGVGPYRGALEVVPTRSDPGSLNVINHLSVNSYVKGSVPGEVPVSWPMATLKAQAVAARSYALSTGCGDCNGFTLYDDTRSQVYGGMAIETRRTSRAVKGTLNEVVKHRGAIAQTYYFSTSGGRTESGFLGGAEVPYLRSVKDPYDFYSPLHRWRFRFSGAEMNAQLPAPGAFRGIRVTQRGDSPRIDYARLIGTGGRATIRGDSLQWALGLYDRWAYFSKAGASGGGGGSGGGPSGGTGGRAARALDGPPTPADVVTGPGAGPPRFTQRG
jgi:stage II sporulation protein D